MEEGKLMVEHETNDKHWLVEMTDRDWFGSHIQLDTIAFDF